MHSSLKPQHSGSGSDYHDSFMFRRAVLEGCCVVLGILVFIGGCANAFAQDYVFAGLEFLYTALSMYSFLKLRKGDHSIWHIYVNAGLLTLIILFGITVDVFEEGLIYSAFVLPLIYHVFLPVRSAVAFSLVVYLFSSAIVFEKCTGDLTYTLINFALSYFGIWALSYAYERSRIKTYQQLKYNALHDVLTGAKNRQALAHDFEHDIIKTSQAFVLNMDIDHFKKINDNYGHQIGDEVLKDVVHKMHTTIDSDYIYRMGGEEFLIILPDVSKHKALEWANQLREKIAETPCLVADSAIAYTMSIGVCGFQPQEGLEPVLNLSDQALYTAKSQGRDQVCLA